MTQDSVQDWTLTNASYSSTCAFPSLSSPRISKHLKMCTCFTLNRHSFREENEVPNLEASNSILEYVWNQDFQSCSQRVTKKPKTVALWLSKFLLFQSGILRLLQFLWTFKNWMQDCAEGVKQQNVLALPNLAAIQQVGMRFHNTSLMHILKLYYI